ncbi:MAG: cation-translocating P-type ATPase [Pirellulaceae bacterium]
MNPVLPTSASCAYCGLPIPTYGHSSQLPEADGPFYCCFGCRFAASVASRPLRGSDDTQDGVLGESNEAQWTLTKLGIAIFFTMNVMVFSLALWTGDVYYADGAQVDRPVEVLHQLFRYLCLIFSLPVMFLLGVPLFDNALEALSRRQLTTDLLLVLGVLAAFVYSAFSVIGGNGHVYFEVGCMVLVSVTLGRWLEATGKLRTTESLRSLERLLPDRVRLVVGGAETDWVDAASIVAGDRMRVLAGERIAVDGCVVHGAALVDEQIVTGESVPVLRHIDDRVLAGALNVDGDLIIEANTSVARGTLQRLVDAAVEAASRKERYGRLADHIARFFTPAVVVLAIGTFAVHAIERRDIGIALMTAMSVVLIACPCALALATPMAIWSALGRASRVGVLFRHGDVLTPLAKCTVVCFDKTGTLTSGQLRMRDAIGPSDDEPEKLRFDRTVAYTLATASSHPLSRSLAEYVTEQWYSDTDGSIPLRQWATEDVVAHAGLGISATIANVGSAYLGSPRYMEQYSQHFSVAMRQACDKVISQHDAIVCVAHGGSVRGVYAAQESIRDDAVATVGKLRDMGLECRILTGDHRRRAAHMAAIVGADFDAELLPDEKLQAIERLKKSGHCVAMVGDGVNDAPALALADIGIALGSGADVARDTAEVCLLGSQLDRIPMSIELARRTVRTVRWNLMWAFVYNVVGIGFAVCGWLNPIVAAIAMLGSSVLVISNSLVLAQTDAIEEQLAPTVSPNSEGREIGDDKRVAAVEQV